MKTLKYIIVALLAVGTGLLTACKEEETTNEPLSVTKISTVVDREVGITVANLAQYVIIQGTGLNNVHAIRVNDVDVDLKQAYITTHEITLQIPRVVPGEISNTITLTANNQTISAPIEVNVPSMVVDGMLNEFTPVGDTMRVVGDYFDLYGITTQSGELFFGGKKMEIAKATGNTLSFLLPADAAEGSQIKLVSPICGEMMVPGKYKERGNILCDFDPYWGWGGQAYLSSGPTPVSVSGQFSHFKNSTHGGWCGETAIVQVGLTYFPEVLDNPGNYVFKFEVNTLKPLVKRKIGLYFSQIGYAWEPFASGLAFNTNGEWKTISIGLDKIWNGALPADGIFQVMGDGVVEDTDISFDNFRIVPKN